MVDEQYSGLFCGREVSTKLDRAGFVVQCNKHLFSCLFRVVPDKLHILFIQQDDVFFESKKGRAAALPFL
jgi:hypothetical protein